MFEPVSEDKLTAMTLLVCHNHVTLSNNTESVNILSQASLKSLYIDFHIKFNQS